MRVVLPSLVKQQPALKVVRATCSYSAAKPEEISFKEGDSVEVLVIDQETGMWEGRVAGTNFAGSFPATHVGDATLIPGPQITAEVKQQARKAHSRKKHKKHAEMVATAAHSFKARTLDELTFSRGEVITIIGSEGADFWKAKLNTKVGYVPKAYVSEPVARNASVSESAARNASMSEPVARNASAKQSPSPTKWQACYAFTGRSADELSFKQGDLIELIEKIDVSWWKGKLEGVLGIFPSNYVKELDAPPTLLKEQKKQKKEKKKKSRSNQVQPQPQPQAPTRREKLQAAHDYKQKKRDELSMVKGEMLTLRQKFDGEWWEVMNCEGKIGVVPKSYLVGIGSHRRLRIKTTSPKPTIEPHVDSPAVAEAENARKKERRERRKKKEKKVKRHAAVKLQACYRGYTVRRNIEVDDDEDDDEVEILAGHRLKDNKLQFKVRWRGCGEDEDEWFPADTLREEWPELVEEYSIANNIYLLPCKAASSQRN